MEIDKSLKANVPQLQTGCGGSPATKLRLSAAPQGLVGIAGFKVSGSGFGDF